MFNIVEHNFTEPVHAGPGLTFEEFNLASLVQSESIVQQIVKFLTNTTFIVSTAYIVQKLVSQSFLEQHLKNMDVASTETIFIEP